MNPTVWDRGSSFDVRILEDGELAGFQSFSGNERNHLFMNLAGKGFHDLSGLSGLDSPADGRAVVRMDYNRDGWNDLVVASSSYPLLQVYRNNGVSEGMAETAASSAGNFVAISLQGGALAGDADGGWSNRDAIGSRVLIKLGEKSILRSLRGGEGLASQNGATLVVGIGDAEQADSVKVVWPSGKQSQTGTLRAGEHLLLDEREGAVTRPYRRAVPQDILVTESE